MEDRQADLASALADRYRIEGVLGRGGMAVVFLAHDLRHRREVAIKVMGEETAASVGSSRFLREVEIAAALNHPHIVPILDSGEVQLGGQAVPFYVTPVMTGESLRDRLSREKRLPVDEAIRLAREIADGLGYAHEHGIVHRDIKPENVLLSGGHAVIGDFGAARSFGAVAADHLTSTGITIGTPRYMSPEQATGETADGRTDQYALACVLYEMLTGEPPFTGASAQVILARTLAAEVPSVRVVRPTVPEAVERALRRALSKERADRFATVADFARAIDTLQPRAWRTYAAGATLVAVAGIAIAVVSRLPRGGPSADTNPDLIAVTPFEVLASDPELQLWREGIMDLLSRNLDGAGPLTSASTTAVLRAWSGHADRASALEVGHRVGAGLVVTGQFLAPHPDSVRLIATLIDASTGAIENDYDIAGSASGADHLVDSLTIALLADLGATRPIQTLRLRGGSRAPLAALKAFLQAEQRYRRASWDSALTGYERAIGGDSTFAFALYRAGQVLAWLRLDSDSLSSEYRYRAARLNHGLAPRDSLLIQADSMSSALYERETPSIGARRQLIAGLESATRRYPADPEVWYALGEEGFHQGIEGGMAKEDVLAALEHAIELDSSLAPAYVHAITIAFETRGRADGLAHAAAFLRHAPAGFQADGIRLSIALGNDRRDEDAESLRRLHPQGLFEGWAASLWSGDSGRAAIRIARELLERTTVSAPGLSDPVFRKDLLNYALLVRGRVREVAAAAPDIEPSTIGSLAMIGAIPPDRAASIFAGWQAVHAERTIHALESWAAYGDTASLSTFARDCRSDAKAAAPCFGTFGAELADAWLALATADTAGALRALQALADTVCDDCVAQRLALVRLLHRDARYDEAATYLRPDIAGTGNRNGLAAMLWKIERARNAELRGDVQAALTGYGLVRDLWSQADPELQPQLRRVDEAMARLSTGAAPQRATGQPRLRAER